MSYDNTNSGILSRNDRKEKDSHPDFKGQINVAGTYYWLSGWIKEKKDGSGKLFSLSVTPKDAQSTPSKQTSAEPDFSDDVPF